MRFSSIIGRRYFRSDYLFLPFLFIMPREGRESYEFGKFRLDVGEHKLTRTDGPTAGTIPEKAFRTLIHLVRNPGRLLTKDELIRTVWPDAIVEENNLAKAVHAIRRFLDDMSDEPKYVETVAKHGYRFVANVKRIETNRPVQEAGSRMMNGGSAGLSPAHSLFLRGKVKYGKVTRADTQAAIDLLEEAIAVDPNFAEAHAKLAQAYIRMAFNFAEGPDRNGFLENAEMAIESALTLEPELAEGHFSRGLILWTHTKGFAHEQAIQSYKRSLAANPNADETHHQLSMVYGHIGLLDEALQTVRKAIDINPNNTMARFRVSNYLAWQCNYEEAILALRTVPSDVSPFLVERIRAETYIHIDRIDDAEEIVDRHLKREPPDDGGSFTSVKALILAKKGERRGAKEAIKRSAEIGNGFGHFHHSAYNIACTYAALGEPEQAVKWLEAVADDGFPCYTYFMLDANLDSLRAHPRFVDLISGLRKQWTRFKQLA